MKMSDILRQYAAMLDAEEQFPAEQPGTDVSVSTDVRRCENPDDVYLPPMQQKLELLKKAVGVENIYDDNETCNDDISDLKKNAGIVVIDDMASDDSIGD